jgi:glucokinase
MSSGTHAGRAPWLVADVGGTNVRFAMAQPDAPAPLRLETMLAYRVAQFPSLADAVRAYLASAQAGGARPASAVFALAGPVRNNQVRMTNFSWEIDAGDLARNLALDSVRLVNDFAAVGMSLPLLEAADMVALGPLPPPIRERPGRQTYCVLGPGTGLGVSALAIRDGVAIGLETEGGHVSFAPHTAEEGAILIHLLERFERVSNERLLCGSGLANLHHAVCAGMGRPQAALATPEDITTAAGNDPACTRAVELFCELLGAAAGDCALAYGAWDGVYLAGGMLAHLGPWLARGGFRRRFEAKGRFAPAMAAVPVGMITHPQAGLLGAAAIAREAAGLPLLRPSGP